MSKTLQTALFLFLACAVPPALAQFSSMATDYAGQRLFFSTELSQTGTSQPAYGKLFIADSRGIQPQLIYPYEFTRNDTSIPFGYRSNFYNIDGVSFSSNGSYMSVIALRECGYSAGLCVYADQSVIWNSSGKVALTADGRLALSPGGKWALGTAGRLTGPITELTLFDLEGRKSYLIAGEDDANARDWLAHGVADNGTAVVATARDGLLILRPPNTKTKVTTTGIQSTAVDAAGDMVLWRQVDDAVYVAYISDPRTAVNIGKSIGAFRPNLSDDGRSVLLLQPAEDSTPQFYMVSAIGTGRRQITNEPEGIADGVLSGNGSIVWALTRTGRLLQYDVAGGRSLQYTPPLAAFLHLQVFPNTEIHPTLQGSPGQVLSAAASVMPGERVELSLEGQSVSVLEVGQRTVMFQIPWTASLNTLGSPSKLEIRKPDSPSWSGNNMDLVVSAFQPVLFDAVHQSFDTVVSPTQPAKPGEIIHLYGAGFGLVNPPVMESVPTPNSPLSRTSTPVGCNFSTAGGPPYLPLDVLFAGLAPGLTGIYQIDVRLPNTLAGLIVVDCLPQGAMLSPAGIAVPIAN